MKQITIDTNLNNKLDCDVFIHIALAPLKPVPESKLKEWIEISTRDESHEPVICRCVDLSRPMLIELRTFDTYASHGLSENEFQEWWLMKYPDCDLGTQMAVYIYKKATAQEKEMVMQQEQVAA